MSTSSNQLNSLKKHVLIPEWISRLTSSIIFSADVLTIFVNIIWVIILLCNCYKLRKKLLLGCSASSGEEYEKYRQNKLQYSGTKVFLLVFILETLHFGLRSCVLISGEIMKAINFQNLDQLNRCIITKGNVPFNGYKLSEIQQAIASFEMGLNPLIILSLAASLKIYSNEYANISNYSLYKYYLIGLLQAVVGIILFGIYWTWPIGSIFLIITFQIDFYFLVKNSKELYKLLIRRRNEANLIDTEVSKKHHRTLIKFKYIWSIFLLSFYVYLVLLSISSLFGWIVAIVSDSCYFSILYGVKEKLQYNRDASTLTVKIISPLWMLVTLASIEFNFYLIGISCGYGIYKLTNKIYTTWKAKKNLREIMIRHRETISSRKLLNSINIVESYHNPYIYDSFDK